MGIWYCTREDVKSALDSKESARNNVQIDRAIEAASRAVEGLTHRRFYPEVDTRYFDWPSNQYGSPWRVWLDDNEVISVTALVSGGTTIVPADYFLEPANSGPPFTHIEIDLDSSASFGGGSTFQRDVAVTGLFGYSDDESPAGTVAEALDTVETSVEVSDGGVIGVGDIIKIDTERMIVTGKSMLDTGYNVQYDLTAQQNNVTVNASGSGFNVGEVILVDSERMLIVDIAGNNLTVKRAWDGSVLAAHSLGADIYALRDLTVTRAALGTTASTHNTAAAIGKHVVPGGVKALAIAEALVNVQQELGAFNKSVRAGDSETEVTGRGITDLRNSVYTTYGRKARWRVV